MTDNNPNDTDENGIEDDAELSTGRDVTLSVGGDEIVCSGIEWTAEADDDTPDVSPQVLPHELTGTSAFGAPVDEVLTEVDIKYEELSPRYRRQHGEKLSKNDAFYPALLRAGLYGTSIESELELEDS